MDDLPRGISFISRGGGRYRVKLRRQLHDYWGGEFLTRAEALAALRDLKRILKETPKLRCGRRKI